MRFGASGTGAPRVALLTSRWGGADESSWALRQVAGTVALSAEVHVITSGGTSAQVRPDGVFIVHDLATEDRAARARRELMLAALVESDAPDLHPPGATLHPAGATETPGLVRDIHELLCEDTGDPWQPAAEALHRIGPDLVVIAGYRELGALKALEDSCPDTPMILVPLQARWLGGTMPARLEHALFAPLCERARCALVFTEAEYRAFEMLGRAGWARWVGLPMSVNTSVENEPHSFVGERDYLLVLSERPLEDDDTLPWTQLLRAGVGSCRIALCTPDAFVVYEDGLVLHELGSGRGSDVLRLMAWATATVDLHPGSLFGRRSLQSLLFGTPVVVPSESIAAEHAARGNGGLWFDGPAQMTWCSQAMLAPAVHVRLGQQGKHYAQERYGSTTSFVERVVAAVELAVGSEDPCRPACDQGA